MGDRTLSQAVLALALLLVAGCATAGAPAGGKNDIYWDPAAKCESRYRTLHLDRIDSDGNASLHADAEARHELGSFIECYRAGIRAEVERRRQAGQPVPDGVNLQPSADID